MVAIVRMQRTSRYWGPKGWGSTRELRKQEGPLTRLTVHSDIIACVRNGTGQGLGRNFTWTEFLQQTQHASAKIITALIVFQHHSHHSHHPTLFKRTISLVFFLHKKYYFKRGGGRGKGRGRRGLEFAQKTTGKYTGSWNFWDLK